MEQDQTLEQKFLKEVGFENDEQLRRYLRKLCEFMQSLNPSEKRVFLATLPTTEDALRSFQLDITAAQLEDFMRKREGACANTILHAHRINCGDGD